MPSLTGGGAVSSSCWGAITATFTWVPSYDGELPPASVIIQEDSSVYAYNDEMEGDPVATPQADDGLGDAATVSPGSTFSMASSSGTAYSVKLDPGQSFSISRSPFTFSSAANGDALTSVSYKAAAPIVTVECAGTTTNDIVLIGQGVQAFLTTNIHARQSNWSWTISGDPFAGFQVTATSGNAFELTAADKTHASVNYYYRSIAAQDHSPSTVTCTATITLDSGEQMQVVGSRQLEVYKPARTNHYSKGIVDISNVGGSPFLLAHGDPIYHRGIDWYGSVTTPDLFIGEEGYGTFCFAQIITPNGLYNPGNHTDPNNGHTGLDSEFPFWNSILLSGYPFPADGSLHEIGDTPGYGIHANITYISMSSAFSAYKLYKPPNAGGGQGTTWVPLWKIDWTAVGAANDFGMGLTLLTLTGPPPSGVTVQSETEVNTLPSWTEVITGRAF